MVRAFKAGGSVRIDIYEGAFEGDRVIGVALSEPMPVKSKEDFKFKGLKPLGKGKGDSYVLPVVAYARDRQTIISGLIYFDLSELKHTRITRGSLHLHFEASRIIREMDDPQAFKPDKPIDLFNNLRSKAPYIQKDMQLIPLGKSRHNGFLMRFKVVEHAVEFEGIYEDDDDMIQINQTEFFNYLYNIPNMFIEPHDAFPNTWEYSDISISYTPKIHSVGDYSVTCQIAFHINKPITEKFQKLLIADFKYLQKRAGLISNPII